MIFLLHVTLKSVKIDFAIAKSMLHLKKLTLTSAVVEDICLSCSHELYDNASSGNYKFGDMKLAYEW
jgi:neuroblastoma-amplified sequence